MIVIMILTIIIIIVAMICYWCIWGIWCNYCCNGFIIFMIICYWLLYVLWLYYRYFYYYYYVRIAIIFIFVTHIKLKLRTMFTKLRMSMFFLEWIIHIRSCKPYKWIWPIYWNFRRRFGRYYGTVSCTEGTVRYDGYTGSSL